jgi:hypothetical protein
MKQMMNISAGFFLWITIMFLIGIAQKLKDKSTTIDYNTASIALIMVGGSGALAVGLAVAGKDKDKAKE